MQAGGTQAGGQPTLEDNIQNSFARFEQVDETQQMYAVGRNIESWERYVDKIEDSANPNEVDTLKQQLRFLENGVRQHKEGLFAADERLADSFVKIAEQLQSKLVEIIRDRPRYMQSRQGRTELPPSLSTQGAIQREQLKREVDQKWLNSGEYTRVLETNRFQIGDVAGELQNMYAQQQLNDLKIQLYRNTGSAAGLEIAKSFEAKGFKLRTKLQDLQNKTHADGGSSGMFSRTPSRSPSQLRLRGGVPSRSESSSSGTSSSSGPSGDDDDGTDLVQASRSRSRASETDDDRIAQANKERLKIIFESNVFGQKLLEKGWSPDAGLLEKGNRENTLVPLLMSIQKHIYAKDGDPFFRHVEDVTNLTNLALKDGITLEQARDKMFAKVGGDKIMHEKFAQIRYGSPPLRKPTQEPDKLAKVTKQLTADGTLDAMYINDDERQIYHKFGIRAKTMREAYHRAHHRIKADASLYNVLQFFNMYGLGLNTKLPSLIRSTDFLTDVSSGSHAGSKKKFNTIRELVMSDGVGKVRGPSSLKNMNDWISFGGNPAGSGYKRAMHLIGQGRVPKGETMRVFEGRLKTIFKGLQSLDYLPKEARIENLFIYDTANAPGKDEPIAGLAAQHRIDQINQSLGGMNTNTQGWSSISPFFTAVDVLDKEFWKLSPEKQVRRLQELGKKERYDAFASPKKWFDALKFFFKAGEEVRERRGSKTRNIYKIAGMTRRDVTKTMPLPNKLKLWTALADEFKQIQQDMGTGDVQQSMYNLRMHRGMVRRSHSPEADNLFYELDPAVFPPEEQKAQEPTREQIEARKQLELALGEGRSLEAAAQFLPNHEFHKYFTDLRGIMKDKESGPVGTALIEGMLNVLEQARQKTKSTLSGVDVKTYESGILKALKALSSEHIGLPYRILGSLGDATAQRAIFKAWGWNVYVDKMGLPSKFRAQTMHDLDIGDQFSVEGDNPRNYVEELLMQYAACSMLSQNPSMTDLPNYKNHLKPQAPVGSDQLLTTQQLQAKHKTEAMQAVKEHGMDTYLPDYEDRIQYYHQAQTVLGVARRGKIGAKPSEPAMKKIERIRRLMRVRSRGTSRLREDLPSQSPESDKRSAVPDDVIERGSSVKPDIEESASDEKDPTEEGGADDEEAINDAYASVGGIESFEMLSPQEQQAAFQEAKETIEAHKEANIPPDISRDERDDAINRQQATALLERANAEFDAYLRSGLMYQAQPHDNELRADVGHHGNIHHVQHVHLLQTDNNIAPVMGRVHLVRPKQGYSDKHFMVDLHGDINEGHRVLVKQAKKGPFRDKGGRTTIYDSSAHTMYRGRRGMFEITVKRGVTGGELQRLASKLSVHSLSQQGSRVVLIKGRRRYVLGFLRDLDIRYILQMVEECTNQYGACGIEISETSGGTGALHKPHVHSRRFKGSSRHGRGSIHDFE